LKITFLGTGTSQGVPVIACECHTCSSEDPNDKRLRTSLMVQSNDITIVFDAGPDFRQQMLKEHVTRLDAIVLTHEHKDHIAGMDDVRAFNFKSQDAIDIYAEPAVQEAVKREYKYVFDNKYAGIPRMRLNDIPPDEFSIKGLKLIPIRVKHKELDIYGFRIGPFAYITDADYIPETSMEKLIGVKYLVINALRKQKHSSHFNLSEAVEHIHKISPRKAYITHIGHQMGRHNEVSAELEPGIMLAYDGLTLTIESQT
jgi:phosphoribosyl 1,2-cyclic phosphate phosphodiesterase